MDRAFFFNATAPCKVSSHNIDARCIYFDDRREVTELEFFVELEKALKATDTLPDCMVVLASHALAAQFQDYWQTNSRQKEVFVERGTRKGLQYIKSYHFFAWGRDDITELYSEVAITGASPQFCIPIDQFIKQGLQRLIEQNNVVQIAPAGHAFKHPSGTVNKVFIQARELAKTEPQLCFIGHAICLAMGKAKFDNLAIVFIDTMSIYHYVREALAFAGSDARIHSFHSYGEVKTLVPPSEAHLVIVSASTSGGMTRDLETVQGFNPARLLTMVDMSANECSGEVLVALDKMDENYARLIADGNETEIELVGEHFSSKAKPPREVTLGEPHTPKQLTRVLKHFGITGMKPINSLVGHGTIPRVVCIDPSPLHGNQDFEEWLKDEIEWSFSLAIDHIVHTDDDASKRIAEQAASIVKTAKSSTISPKLISYNTLSIKELETAHGLLVVTAVAGDGGLLREISRDLREYVPSTLPRHFLVGVGFPQSNGAWSRLAQFLERNPTHRRYGFSAWLVLPIGPDNTDNAWESMAKLSGRAQVGDIDFGVVGANVAEVALKALSTAVSVSHNGFLPKPDGTPLSLSDGFVFFGNEFNGRLDSVTTSDAFLAVTAVLQAARDLKDAKNQLNPTGYESVVLSPECFLRFNDNMLQACLLRACHPSELDYSASPHYSTLMKEFLSKVFDRHGLPYGAASIEFAAALATGRLKLKEADKKEVLSHAIDRLKLTSSPLLGFLLMANQ